MPGGFCLAGLAMDTLLQVRELTAEFRGDGVVFRAVDGVSFAIAREEVLGVMGESGCGKTTLALALLGLHDSQQVAMGGAANFHGADLLKLGERELRAIRGAIISLIAQEPGVALCPVRRVGEQIAEVAHAHPADGRQSWKECHAEAHAWLKRVGLEPTGRFFAAYPHQLSGGQLQRVTLAQALICGPELMIADEPTAALDARHQAEFVALLRDLKRELGLSVLLVSHTPEIQAALADRVMVMKAGRIVEEGPVLKVFREPKDEYTRTLLHRATQEADGVSVRLPAARLAARLSADEEIAKR